MVPVPDAERNQCAGIVIFLVLGTLCNVLAYLASVWSAQLNAEVVTTAVENEHTLRFKLKKALSEAPSKYLIGLLNFGGRVLSAVGTVMLVQVVASWCKRRRYNVLMKSAAEEADTVLGDVNMGVTDTAGECCLSCFFVAITTNICSKSGSRLPQVLMSHADDLLRVLVPDGIRSLNPAKTLRYITRRACLIFSSHKDRNRYGRAMLALRAIPFVVFVASIDGCVRAPKNMRMNGGGGGSSGGGGGGSAGGSSSASARGSSAASRSRSYSIMGSVPEGGTLAEMVSTPGGSITKSIADIMVSPIMVTTFIRGIGNGRDRGRRHNGDHEDNGNHFGQIGRM
ncbi:hypothetical protein Aduo_011455 [Ancylostoma duodenale]